MHHRCRHSYQRDIFDPEPRLVRLFIKHMQSSFSGALFIFGLILVGIAWIVFAFMTYLYFMYLLPLLALSPMTFPGNLITTIGVWILVNLYYNHFFAIYTPPGHIPDDIEVPDNIKQLIAEEQEKKRSERRKDHFTKYCRVCILPKPDRTHHCHICKKCVLRMDHHCPWVANCVGFANYKFFYLFVFYLCIGSLFLCSICSTGYFSLIVPYPDRRDLEMYAFTVMIISACTSVALGGMLGLHTYLILTNQTTIELYINHRHKKIAKQNGEEWSNPYDLGWRQNWQSIFGERQFCFSWLLPGGTTIGDGMHFTRKTEKEGIDLA